MTTEQNKQVQGENSNILGGSHVTMLLPCKVNWLKGKFVLLLVFGVYVPYFCVRTLQALKKLTKSVVSYFVFHSLAMTTGQQVSSIKPEVSHFLMKLSWPSGLAC